MFAKGQSGNPGGRPKESLTSAIRAQIGKKSPEGPTYRTLVAQKLIELATVGNIEAIKIVLERIDGKVAELRTVEGQINIALSWDNGTSNDD